MAHIKKPHTKNTPQPELWVDIYDVLCEIEKNTRKV